MNPRYTDWADSLELQDFVIGQLVGPEPAIEDARSGLTHLICESRPEIVRALVKVFGDQTHLFASLWRINETAVEPADNDEDEPVLVENLVVRKFPLYVCGSNWAPHWVWARDTFSSHYPRVNLPSGILELSGSHCRSFQ